MMLGKIQGEMGNEGIEFAWNSADLLVFAYTT